MINAFIVIRFLDLLDIFLVAFIMYKLYMAIKGTVAFNIFMGIFILYITWRFIDALNMELMGSLMGQVMAAGVLVLVVVFQQEIRKALLVLGSRFNLTKGFSFEHLFSKEHTSMSSEIRKEITSACEAMSESKTGALIVLTNKAELKEYIDTGETINSRVSGPLLETIFFKNSPLHDGAVIIQGEEIKAARCVLPVTKRRLKNAQLGLRHRSALGMSEATDAQIIIVSEETGYISVAINGEIEEHFSPVELYKKLEEVYKE